MSSFLAPAMKRLLKPTQKLKPGLLPKNIIPKNKWSILRGDKVHVVNGVHTGKVGVVQTVIRKQNRIIVEGVNMRKYSKKPEGGGRGVTVTREGAIHVTNVNLVCPQTGYEGHEKDEEGVEETGRGGGRCWRVRGGKGGGEAGEREREGVVRAW
eukprot:jgi/Undpi1/7681/HiC_scaffold_23.g10154.m1